MSRVRRLPRMCRSKPSRAGSAVKWSPPVNSAGLLHDQTKRATPNGSTRSESRSADARQLAYRFAPLGTISAGGFADFGNVNVALAIDRNAVWRRKLNGRRRIIAPACEQIPVQVQNRNPGRPILTVRWLHERKQRSALA